MAKTRNAGGPDLHGGRMRVPRSRGALSGALLIILGAWGALIPFVGPYVDFGYTPNATFELTKARVLLELLPGAVAALGGLLLLVAANRSSPASAPGSPSPAALGSSWARPWTES